MRLLVVQGFQRESTSMKMYKILKGKITWGNLVKLASLVEDYLGIIVSCHQC